ncbi:MAG: CvpA family protein [Candidatus Margulisiibacteriota bacterium]
MLDLIVGIAILGFVVLGLREGIAKALGSLVLVFIALFLATGTVNFLAKSAPQFSDPNFLGATIIFLVVWLVSYLLLDILLTVVFKKIITIVILGPFDKVGGLLIGGFKGVVICGIVLQLVLYFPISKDAKEQIKNSALSRFSIATYHWVYPYAKRIAPAVSDFMKKNLEEKTGELEKLGSEFGEVKSEKEEKIKKLLKDQKLLPTVPQGPVDKK